jgi:H/ACA ribonucleoprotein complex subunit 4
MKIDLEKIKQKKSVKELLEFGIINIDKPSGPTSFDVSDFVRKKLNLRKTSHFGTLDPKVTGVLPIALNRACKLTGYFLGEDKEYVGIMRIHEEISLEELKKAIKEKFLGKIMQKPPVKSRVKRVEREREVKSFEILEQDGKDFLFRACVQGGTYIRKLIDDLGREIKVGAHMLELRRVRAGIFDESKIYTLYDLEKALEDEGKLKEMIIPGEIVSEVYTPVEIKKDSVERILHGQPIYNKNLVKQVKIDKDKIISVFCGEQFVGMFMVKNEGEVFARGEFVLQEIKI